MDNATFIIAAYAVAGIGLCGLILFTLADYWRQKRRLAESDDRTMRR